MSLIVWLLNTASICFLIAEILSLYRSWVARDKMESTSLEGRFMHFLGNSLFVGIGYLTRAWISLFIECFLAVTCFIILILKLKWVIVERQKRR